MLKVISNITKDISGYIQFQELTQESGSTEETSPRTSKSRKYFVCILYEKPEMKIISGKQVDGSPKARSISFAYSMKSQK